MYASLGLNECLFKVWIAVRYNDSQHFGFLYGPRRNWLGHYIDVIMTTMASQITRPTIVYSTVYSDADQRKHQSSASVAFVWGIHRDRWIPRAKGQLRGNVSIWWRHHERIWNVMVIIRQSLIKNIERHTAHASVSWPNPKQGVISHTSNLMLIIRQSI